MYDHRMTPRERLELHKEIARLMGASLDENGLKVSAELKNKCNNFKINNR